MAFVGTGTTISFASSFLAEILDIGVGGLSREAIDTTHMGTSVWKTFVPGDLSDPGELEVEIAFDPALTPPINSAPESITITFSDSGAATWVFSGFMVGFSAKTPLEGRATGTARIKISGVITITA